MKRDLLINAAGIGSGQLVLLVATPFLARIYSPAEFGVYASVLAAVGVFSTIAALRFDVALPAVSEEDVRPLFHAAIALPFVLSIGMAVVFDMLPLGIGALKKIQMIPLSWFAVIVALIGATTVCQAWAVRSGDFISVAALRVFQPVVFVSVAACLTLGLNESLILSYVVVMLYAVWAFRHAFFGFEVRRSWAAVKRARKYPFISLPMALLDVLSLALPVLFITTQFGAESAGNYSQAQRLLGAPLVLLGGAISQVFFKHAGDLLRSGGDVESLMWRVVIYLSGLAALLVIGIGFVGEPVLSLLLGDAWRTDVQFLLLVIAPLVFRMIASPISTVFLIANRLGLCSIWQASYFSVTLSIILLARDWLGFEDYLLALGFAELAMYSIYLSLAVFAVRGQRGR
jgi:O-antigen/teichoic acid export membrane protein